MRQKSVCVATLPAPTTTTTIALLKRERDEALEQQKATAEVLRLVSSSPGDLKRVFAAILQSATRLCQAKFGTLYLAEDSAFRAVAMHNAPRAFVEARRRQPLVTGTMVLARLARTKKTVQVADMAKNPAYRKDPQERDFITMSGVRSLVSVPMLKDNDLIGVITVYRQEVRPFTDKQVELLTNFAAQAVIAIENTRLLNELRGRTQELTEALEQRTATSDVLGVISSSPGELTAVFDTILANALRLCDADTGHVLRAEAGTLSVAATRGGRAEYAQFWRERGPWRPAPHSAPAQAMEQKKPVQIDDMCQTSSYAAGGQITVAAVELGGLRTVLMVPMIADEKAVGIIVIYRSVVRPFSDKQITLVQNFAAQAVIAIENTRLLNELRESLQQQTATAEVLSVISSSPGDLEPVFDAMLANAVRICNARFGNLLLFDGHVMRMAAMHNAPHAYEEARRGDPVVPMTAFIGPIVTTKEVIHINDLAADERYANSVLARVAGARTALAVPMLRDNELVGAIAIYHQDVQPFNEKQIDLVRNFAAQAVIAIENTRLLNELRQSLEQQTATADVLSVISTSPGELEPVFQAMLANATRICGAKFGAMFYYREGGFHPAAQLNVPIAYSEFIQRRGSFQPNAGSTFERLVRTKQVIHLTDAAAEGSYPSNNAAKLGGARSYIAVPMLKESELVGAIAIYRQEVLPFTDKQIALVQNFAAQAVIAIENTRLLNELRQRTGDLTEALEQQTATAEILGVISKSLSDTQPVFDAIVQSGVRLFSGAAVSIALVKNGMVKAAAVAERDPVRAELWRRRFPIPLTREYLTSVAILDRKMLDIPNVENVPEEMEVGRTNLRETGYRAATILPLMRGEAAIGALTVLRIPTGPLTEKQLAALKNYAKQAEIAIENARLLNELRQRTDDLTELLDQQTATSEVLKVISSSPGNLEAVFQAMLENAIRICDARFGTLLRFDGNAFHLAAGAGLPPKLAEFHRQHETFQPIPGSPLDRAMQTKRVSHTVDDAAETLPSPPAQLAGARSMVCVPMLKDNTLIGAIVIYRQEVQPFTDKQIELLENFAAQAVIAIENTRLLNELRESLEQQTATSRSSERHLKLTGRT